VIWFLTWTVLVLVAIAVLAFLGLRLYRKGKALLVEMSAASARLGDLSAALADQPPPRDTGPAARR
jgi:hypothetical protein